MFASINPAGYVTTAIEYRLLNILLFHENVAFSQPCFMAVSSVPVHATGGCMHNCFA